VYTKSKEEHESHLKINLELLKKEKCHVKPNKVEADGRVNRNVAWLGPTSGEKGRWRFILLDRIWILMVGDIRTLFMEGVYAVHPETDCQSERTFWALENMFKACVRNLVVVGILTFHEAGIRESKMIGLELEQETTKVFMIKERLKEAKDRQESVIRFGKKGKLTPRYVGPSEILERIGPVAYRLRLPKELSGEPIEIMDHEVKRLKRSRISLVKIRWNSKRGPELTWECEDFMKSKYPQLFVD
nr:hypothetical protein [Tanacetum cinerariifolium]